MVAITGDTAASSFRMTLLNVSWLIFEVENEFIRAALPEENSHSGGVRHGRRPTPSTGSDPEFEGLVGHEHEHVPDLFRLVFLHRDDDRVGAAGAQVVHQDVEELAQDLRVVVDREAVDRVSTTRAFRSGFLRRRNSTFSMMFSSIVGLSTTIEWGWRFAWDIMICVMQSTNQMCSTGISRASIAFRMLWLGIVDVT